MSMDLTYDTFGIAAFVDVINVVIVSTVVTPEISFEVKQITSNTSEDR